MTSQATPSHLAQTDHESLHHAHTVTEHTLAIPIKLLLGPNQPCQFFSELKKSGHDNTLCACAIRPSCWPAKTRPVRPFDTDKNTLLNETVAT